MLTTLNSTRGCSVTLNSTRGLSVTLNSTRGFSPAEISCFCAGQSSDSPNTLAAPGAGRDHDEALPPALTVYTYTVFHAVYLLYTYIVFHAVYVCICHPWGVEHANYPEFNALNSMGFHPAEDLACEQVKAAILSTLSLLLVRGGIMMKPFLPQLQTTFVKSLSESSKVTH